jgi:putative transposase
VFRTLNIIDVFTKETLAIRVRRKLNSTDVVDALTRLFFLRGPPEFIRSDNGAEFIAGRDRDWIAAVGAKTAFIEPGSPWENGYCESFNSRFHDELLIGEVFYTLREAQILIERWRRHYNTIRPHSSLGYRPPAPDVLSRWTGGRPCTNIQSGSLGWGQSTLAWEEHFSYVSRSHQTYRPLQADRF